MMSSFLSGHWLPLVVNTLLQSLLVLAVAALVLVCARNASAARRHLITVAALGALLLAPLISLMIPAPKPLLQVSESGFDLRRSPVVSLSSAAGSEKGGVTTATPNPAAAPGHATEQVSASSPASPGVIVSRKAATSIGSPAAAPVSLARFVPWLALFWLIGVLGVLGRLLVGLERIRRIARQSSSVLPEALQAQIRAVLAEVGFARPITLMQSSNTSQVSVAMTWGVQKPILLLPAEAAEWSEERLRVVVLHELAHIRRHDWLTQMFGQIVCALYWFHPLVWLLNRTSQIEAERACDDAVLLAGVRAKEYATHLLDVVKAMKAGREAPSAAVAMARPMQVRFRMQSILNAQRNRSSATRSVLTLVLSVTALLLCAASWLRPLAWAARHPQPTVPNQAKVTGPVVNLPNGIAIELVAVGSDPMGFGDDWWTPDGKPLIEPPAYSHPVFVGGADPFGTQYLRRALFFRVRTQQQANVSLTGYIVDPAHHLQTEGYHYGRGARLSDSEIAPTDVAGGIVRLGFPHKDTQCTYRFGVATAPWETIATTRFALNPTQGAISIPATAIPNATALYSDDNPRISYREAQGQEHILSLLGGHAPLEDVARRVVALDKNGKEVVQQNNDYEVPKGSSPLPLWAQARIVEFRLQTRPYQWGEFKNIHLEHLPVVKPASIPTPPVLPAFRHTFACGVTMTISAVTESRKEGGLWWQPNGKSLAGPLKEWPAVVFPNWGQKMLERTVLFQLQSPRALSYTTAMRFTPAETDDQVGMPPGFESQIAKNKPDFTWWPHDFPQHLSHTTMRYGIATGPWKSVASIPMPQDVRHSDDTQEPQWADLTIEVPGYPQQGEFPRVSYTTAEGKVRDLPFTIQDTSYLSDVARRFVAVDKEGKIILLRSNTFTHQTLDQAGKPIPLDAAYADTMTGNYKRREFDGVSLAFRSVSGSYKYNPIDLTKIREFRLEVRPYEWAEFADIALQPAKGTSAR